MDSTIAAENARHQAQDCATCIGFGVVERDDGPPSRPDRPRPVCPACQGTGRKS